MVQMHPQVLQVVVAATTAVVAEALVAIQFQAVAVLVGYQVLRSLHLLIRLHLH
jgi:hypothetical protein